jgi:HEPN domain-containing protein
MRPSEDELRLLVVDWAKKAELDLAVAGRLAGEADRFRDAVAFHSQQAAEKYLKALLVRHQVEFPKTHDIEKLLELLRPVEPQVFEMLLDAKWLTPFGVDIRYPGDFPETLPGDERKALQLAQRVQDTVMGVLGAYLDERPE